MRGEPDQNTHILRSKCAQVSSVRISIFPFRPENRVVGFDVLYLLCGDNGRSTSNTIMVFCNNEMLTSIIFWGNTDTYTQGGGACWTDKHGAHILRRKARLIEVSRILQSVRTHAFHFMNFPHSYKILILMLTVAFGSAPKGPERARLS